MMDFPLDFVLNSDEDEDIMEVLALERRPYTIRLRIDNFEKWDNHEFFVRFRLKKESVLLILGKIENTLEFPTDRNHCIRPIDQLLLALRFYATGKFLICCGDFCNISKSSARKIIKRVTNVVATLSNEYIKMPSTQEEILTAQQKFYAKARFPRVIGSIDCTHVAILSPGGQHAETFRNRKGYFSLNVQTVAATNLKILDIVARWPGSAHDQHIFNNSNLKQRFENNEFGNALLVGDSDYTNTKYLVTPLLNTRNEVEERYNESLIRTRNPVERQYGVWKKRFPVLASKLRLKLETAMAVIITTVLHNIAVEQREEQPPDDPDVNVEENIFNWNLEPIGNELLGNACAELLANYFPNLVRGNI